MFYDISEQMAYETIIDFQLAHPMTSYGDLTQKEYRDSIGLVTLVKDSPPYDHLTEKLVAGLIEEDGEFWYQRYDVVEMTEEEAQDYKKTLVPKAVTMRQARLALLSVDKLSGVQGVIDALPEPQKTKGQIEWEFSQEVQRNNSFVSIIGPALGLSEDQMDDLFILAKTL